MLAVCVCQTTHGKLTVGLFPNFCLFFDIATPGWITFAQNHRNAERSNNPRSCLRISTRSLQTEARGGRTGHPAGRERVLGAAAERRDGTASIQEGPGRGEV